MERCRIGALSRRELLQESAIKADAPKASKDVCNEKRMAHTTDAAKDMARAAKRTKRVLQLGHHRASTIGYNHAYELINSKKVCGRVTHVRAQWNRNGSWRRS